MTEKLFTGTLNHNQNKNKSPIEENYGLPIEENHILHPVKKIYASTIEEPIEENFNALHIEENLMLHPFKYTVLYASPIKEIQ